MTSLSRELIGSDLNIWTGYASLYDNLRDYLKSQGWIEQSPGRAGALWHGSDVSGAGRSIIVPSHVEPGSFEWQSVVKRLAAFEHKPVDDIIVRIATQYVDVTRLQADGDDVVQGSIPLKAGARLVGSARTMLRSVGTTARRHRAAIDGNYSLLGDDIVSQARMAHTEDGSYIVPILMPLRPPSPVYLEQDALEGMQVELMPVESSERRVTRMLAQSIAAVNDVIVKPEHSPQKSVDLMPFITAGGSKELLTALHAVLKEPSVAQLETSFTWAGGVNAPGKVADRVVLDAEAAPRIEMAARLLHPSQHFPGQLYTGQIVAIMHRPGDDYGNIELATVHNSRRCQLRIQLTRDLFNKTYDWARDELTVFVEGEVERIRNRLTMENPRRMGPLDQIIFSSGEQ